jgi:hypothetical protein
VTVGIFTGGAIVPYGSLNYNSESKDSGKLAFVSSITGGIVRLTADSFTGSKESVTAREMLEENVRSRTETAMPVEYSDEQSMNVEAGMSVGSDGKATPYLGVSVNDNGHVMSAYVSPKVMEGLQSLKDGISHLQNKLNGAIGNDAGGKDGLGAVDGSAPNPKAAPANNNDAKQLNDKIEEILDRVPEADKPKVKEFSEQLKKVENNVIIVRDLPPLPGAKVADNDNFNTATTNAKTFAHVMGSLIGQYKEFSQEYPNLAEYGLSIANIGIQTLVAGPLGFVNGVRSETTGYAVSKALEEPTAALLGTLLTETSEKTKSKFPELSDKEARDFTAGIIIGGAAITAGTLAIKHIIKKIDDFHYHDVKLGDVRLDIDVSPAAKKFFDNISIYERKTAEVMNKQIEKWYPKAPFAEKTIVDIFKIDNTMQDKFIRFYKYDPEVPSLKGQFIALRDDVLDNKGNLFPAVKIKEMYDLPEFPTHVSNVNPKVGTELAVGIVKPGNFGEIGKGTQFYFVKESNKDWFANGELLK